MDAFHIILLVAALAAAGAAVFIALGRAGLQARAAAAEAGERAARDEAAGLKAQAEQAAAQAAARLKEEVGARESRIADLTERNHGSERRVALLEAELDAAAKRHDADLRKAQAILNEQLKAVEQRERDLKERIADLDRKTAETFKALASDALKSSNESFLKLATESLTGHQKQAVADLEQRKTAVEQMLKPISEALSKTDQRLSEIRKEWTSDRATLGEQLASMTQAGQSLREETGRLTRALSKPEVRGRYGEIQLRRVAELAGMTSYCDFAEQNSARTSDGDLLRPDMVVKLPNDRCIAVDAKANTYAYLEAVNAKTPEEAEEHMMRFTRHMTDQVAKLSKKGYWQNFDGSPDFVVMFVPGDQFLDAALTRQPELIEKAAQARVILATPSTLIGLLRAVAVGWQESRLAEEAIKLNELGKELHDRAATAMEHICKVGESLEKATRHFNGFVGSYESRMEPTLRKFEDAGARSGKELPELKRIENRPREDFIAKGVQKALPGSENGH